MGYNLERFELGIKSNVGVLSCAYKWRLGFSTWTDISYNSMNCHPSAYKLGRQGWNLEEGLEMEHII